MDKLVTFAIPCYNSAAYMDACVQSILDACAPFDDFEVIIVDDGSQKDDTAAKADDWERRCPGLVRAVHQENGGHGAAVLAGLENARGRYYKVVDSDDWVDRDAVQALLAKARELIGQDVEVDLFITNYVYEHGEDDTRHVVNYRSILPCGRVFTWDEMGSFRMDQNLLMHSLMYRTEVLREGGVPLPRHTFYVDNIYAYVPLPRCKNICYLDVDLYRYYIGREDQSVNEKVMVSRYEQQLRITRIMMESCRIYDEVQSAPLRAYMQGYFTNMMAISSLFGHMSDDPASDDKVKELWAYLKQTDERMYDKARHHIMGIATNLPGKLGKSITQGLYHVARKVVKFN